MAQDRWLRGWLIVAALVIPLACASAEVVVRMPLIIPNEREAPNFPNGLQPGRGAAKEPAPPHAFRFAWDNYTSVVVVGEGTGLARPAWVLTYDQKGDFVVGYRARAFRDAAGFTHIDARNALDSGPMSDQWSPDSFAFAPDGTVFTLDDQQHGNQGAMQSQVDAGDDEYDHLLILAQALISGAT